jgi:hypothetical protein
MTAPPVRPAKPWWTWPVRLGVTALLLWAVTTQVQWSAVFGVLASARWGPLAVAVGIMTVWRLLGAWQLKLVMDQVGMRLGVLEIVAINLSAAFYELFLPSRLAGGAVRFYRFSRSSSQWMPTLAALTFNRFVETLTLVALGLGFWAADPLEGQHPAVGLMLLGLFAGLLLFHAEVKHRTLWSAVSRWGVIRRGREWVPQAVRRAADRTVGELARLYRQYRLRHGSIVLIGGLSAVRHLLGVIAYVWLGRAIGLELAWVSVGWVRTVFALVMLLPVAVGGFGLREGSLVLLLAPLGVEAPQAVAFSLLIFALSLIFGLIGGLLELRQGG